MADGGVEFNPDRDAPGVALFGVQSWLILREAHHRDYAVVCLVLLGCRSSSDYLERAGRQFSAGRYDDAVIEYRKAIQKDTHNADASTDSDWQKKAAGIRVRLFEL